MSMNHLCWACPTNMFKRAQTLMVIIMRNEYSTAPKIKKVVKREFDNSIDGDSLSMPSDN